MKNTILAAGLALGLAVAPLSFARDLPVVPGNFATVTLHCNGAYKNTHRVKVIVAKKFNNGGVMVFKKLRCGTTRDIRF